LSRVGETQLKRTALHDFHAARGARLVPFAGWEMPVQYTGILQEHLAVRSGAGLFDVSHMGIARVEGPGAAAFLDRVLTNRVAPTRVGKAVYALLCQEDGGVVDDLIAYRLEESTFLLVLNAANAEKDLAWLERWREGFECTLEDLSPNFGLLALQGPDAAGILEACLGDDGASVAALPRFGLLATRFMGTDLLVARTGYTGEDGFEMFVPTAALEGLATRLADWDGVSLAGLGARDSLRLEAGFPLYGHEISETLSPLQAGLGFAVKLKKDPPFVGRDALAAQKAAGADPLVRFFHMEGKRIARQGDALFATESGGEAIGEVLSGTQSPCLGRPIGSLSVQSALADRERLFAEIRGKRHPLRLARPPLHKLTIES
jgi:aminomethyltransferase